ncbi:CCA-adding enzyme [Bienertia sinuspersici]
MNFLNQKHVKLYQINIILTNQSTTARQDPFNSLEKSTLKLHTTTKLITKEGHQLQFLMEHFTKANFIKLRSHHNRYLVAGSDGESVRQSKNGHTRQARWAVEVVQGKPNMIHLRSCYNKFLTASEDPFLLGWTGKKALQTVQSDCSLSVQWEPISYDFYVKLQAPQTGKFLRANAWTPPWRGTVTVDVPERKATQDWVLWVVDKVDDHAAHDDFGTCSWPKKSSKSLPHKSNVFACYKASYSMANNVARYESLALMAEDESDQSSSSGSPTSATSIVGTYKSGMELFQNAKRVRLRSHHDKYLLADDDGDSVCQDRHGGSKYARWTVEYVKSVEGVNLVRFKSCFDKYLTATDDDFLLGVTGKKVKQTVPRRLDSSIEWEPLREGMQVRLKTRYGNFLRANGGLPPWRNSITHDVPSRSHTQDWVLWEIEVLEVYEEAKQVEVESDDGNEEKMNKLERLESEFDASCFRTSYNSGHSTSSLNIEGRIIHYNVVDDDGNIVDEEEGERSFVFNGTGLQELTQMLEEELGLTEVTLCSRSPLNGMLYPMRLALPPNHVKLHVYVVPSTSKAAADFISS